MLSQLASELEAAGPEVIVLGGDLADFPWGHSGLRACLEQLQQVCPVLAIPGNHDHWIGLSRLKRNLPGLIWLDEAAWQGPGSLRLCGRVDQGATDQSVLVGHHPTSVKAAARAGFSLMLAGHLHGCQWIWFERGGRDYPGAWFFAYHGERFQVGPTCLLVSRGVSDTLPLRIDCPRDYLLLELCP